MLLLLWLCSCAVPAQDGQLRRPMLDRFDANGDGRLDSLERQELRQFFRSRNQSALPEFVQGLYGSQPGPHQVACRDLVLHDDQRDKDLQIRLTYPKSAGPSPLIVFSHGAFGSHRNYGPLVEHWVSHGYVVVQATHSDSLLLGSRGRTADVTDPRNFQDWYNRPLDVKFILDNLERLQVPIDKSRIGVGGHSYGAHTAQLLAGARTLPGAHGSDHSDPRPKAFLLVSPQGRGSMLHGDSWKGITRPMMVITGSEDRVRTGEEPETRLDPYDLSAPGSKHLLWIEGATHNFGGISGRAGGLLPTGGPNPKHLGYVFSTSLAFWDAYLKGNGQALNFLNTARIPESQLVHR